MPSTVDDDRVVIEPLWRCPQKTGATAELLCLTWPGYYGISGAGDALRDATQRARRKGYPFGLVAVSHDQRIVGHTALAKTSFGAIAGEAPWLIGLCVAADMRGRGIATALVKAAEQAARAKGANRIFATTQSAAGILRRSGWQQMRDVTDASETWAVLRKTL